MCTQKELYCAVVRHVYFVGIGPLGFIENLELERLTLKDVRMRKLKDPTSFINEHDIYVLTKSHLKAVFNYTPKVYFIPSMTFRRGGIDKLIAFSFEENCLKK